MMLQQVPNGLLPDNIQDRINEIYSWSKIVVDKESLQIIAEELTEYIEMATNRYEIYTLNEVLKEFRIMWLELRDKEKEITIG